MATLVLIHVALSLVGIGSGFIVVYGLITAKRLNAWTALFLITTVATSVSGFFLPAKHLSPSHVVGAVSLLALAFAIYGRYSKQMAGLWRLVYVLGSILALYLNVFVGVIQAFLKVPSLRALAPHQSEPPFAVTQLIVLVLFVALGILAAKKFRVSTAPAAATAAATTV